MDSLAITPFSEAIARGEDFLVEELWDAPKAILAQAAQKAAGKHLLILTGGEREGRLYEDLLFFSKGPVHEFPAWENLPSESIAPSPDVVGERYEVLKAILHAKEPQILLAPVQAALQSMLSPELFKKAQMTLTVGQEYPPEWLVEELGDAGFVRRPVVSDKGEFAVRGGIVDLFPLGKPSPYRIEFFGDEIEKIRPFDPGSQRSIGEVRELTLTLADEFTGKKTATLFDYLGPNTCIVFDDLLALEDRLVALGLSGAEFSAWMKKAAPYQKLYWPAAPIETLGEVEVDRSIDYYSEGAPPHPITFPLFDQKISALRWKSPFHSLQEGIPDNTELHLICENQREETRLRALLKEMGITSIAAVHEGYMSSGFTLDGVTLLPITELTHHYKVRRQQKRASYSAVPHEGPEFIDGDLVVHFHHGIGQYLGIVKKEDSEGKTAEYLAIEYASKGKLFVPLTQSYLISKYVGGKEEKPTLHTLGSGKWARVRAQTEEAIRKYAQEMLKAHAQREIAGGFAFPPDSEDTELFESEFPYVETEDQLKAIRDVKGDMQQAKPMDRLVCGDVGYGKTEVAMRAAFKTVIDGGKQVAILVPTTVLAMQHYDNFCQRMENFPVRIGVLSRFRTPKEQKATLKQLADGSLDILIGTHRIISKDVQFANLGLVVVDEEQRFGVRVKEKIRAFKAGVDCLTLSATPIPRTLYLALMGGRDLSIIATPPQDRLPIKTHVGQEDPEKTKAALLRELARDGQAIIIHNRVETIYGVAERLRKTLPKARIGVAHGQMGGDALDEVFHAFRTGKIQILVATTIVENGLDIPNANTIIVERADRHGLADLYQMRGRVGRWNRRAYAYFLTSKKRPPSGVSKERLDVLEQLGPHGGGFKVAMRDLEIRGGGSILGTEQSGHVSAIGFHLYCKMLKRTVNSLQGKTPHTLTEVKLEFPQRAYLPEEYLPESSLRLEFYGRFGEAATEAEVDNLYEELKDRFGTPPERAIWFYHLMRIRAVASRLQITGLKFDKMTLTIEKKDNTTRKVLLPKIEGPQDLEELVVRAIS